MTGRGGGGYSRSISCAARRSHLLLARSRLLQFRVPSLARRTRRRERSREQDGLPIAFPSLRAVRSAGSRIVRARAVPSRKSRSAEEQGVSPWG